MDSVPTVSARLAGFVAGLDITRIPPEIVEFAKFRVLDCLGTALAARDLPVPSVARRFIGGAVGPASLIGFGSRVPIVDAALVNATLVNGRSQDDFLHKSHPGAVTLPAALAIAEAHGRSGADLLAAIIAGYEVVARTYLGGPRMLPRFRATGVAGTVGAAAAAARALKLDAAAAAHALGCAAVFSHGFGQGFLSGTTEVKLNVGMASRNGASAALLAASGATASALAFEGASGFYRAFDGDLSDVDAATRGLGDRLLITDTVYKECPVCIFTQTPIALARSIAERVEPSAIDRVVISSPEPTHTNPGFTNVAPFATHLQAVVSARFCTAAALLGRPVESYEFYDHTDDPEVLALAERIELHSRTAGEDDTVELEVTQRGHTLCVTGIECETLRPTPDKILAKFRRLVREVPAIDADRVIEQVLKLDTAPDLRGFSAALAPRSVEVAK